MLLANYASDDSDAESDSGPSGPFLTASASASKPINGASKQAAKGPSAGLLDASTAARSLTGVASGSKVKRKGPVKITLDLPTLADEEGKGKGKGKAEKTEGGDDDEDEEDEGDRAAKKPKLQGAGGSALLGMLPPPKRKIVSKGPASKPIAKIVPVSKPVPVVEEDEDEDVGVGAGIKGSKAPEAELDLFGLSAAPARSKPIEPTSLPKPINITSAPTVSDFIPPDPTPNDPYPGYYQLPSGSWAAYEPEYYASFFATPEADPDANKGDDGRIGKHWDQLDELARNGIMDVDVSRDLDEARRAQEVKSKVIKPTRPGDEFQYQTIGQVKGLASERHQLSSLLNTAFSQRDELEARIQQNKKNMRLGSAKYGF